MAGRQDWGVPPAFQTVPPFAGPGDPAIQFGTDPIPPEIPFVVQGQFGATWQVIAVIIYRRTETAYWFDALVIPSSPTALGNLMIARGSVDGLLPGTLGTVSQAFIYNSVIGGSRLRFGTASADLDIVIGEATGSGNAGIDIKKDPLISNGSMLIAVPSGVITMTAVTITLDAETRIPSGHNLHVDSGGDIEVNSGGDINVNSGGNVNVNSGGDIEVLSGGSINLASGSDIVLAVGSTYEIDTFSAPRGFVGQGSSSSNSSAIGTTETVVLSFNAELKSGRAYACFLGQTVTLSGSTNTVQFRVRQQSGNNILLGAVGPSGSPQEVALSLHGIFRRTSGGNITASIEVTMQTDSGTATWLGNGSTRPRWCRIEDIGASGLFPNAQEFNGT